MFKKRFVSIIISVFFIAASLSMFACSAKREPIRKSAYKIACLGDSITFNTAADPKTLYPSLLAKEECFEYVQNVGYSGSTIADVTDKKDMKDKTFVKRANLIKSDVDIIFVFGGTNDYGSSYGVSPLGKADDRRTDTFYGALNILVEYLKDQYPNAKILFATPLQRDDNWWGGPPDSPVNKHGVSLEDIRQAIIDVCLAEGLEYIDLYCLEGMRLTDQTYRDYFLDGLHPNARGHELIASCLVAKFKEMMNIAS